ERLLDAGITIKPPERHEGPLSGKIFVLTGSLTSMTRGQAEERIKALGGTIGSAVTKKTDYVVVGADPGSKLEQAQRLKVPALDMTMVVTLAVVFLLASTDAIIRRHGRLLPIAFGSVALGLVWLAHMLTFPGVLPGNYALVSSQAAPYLFQLGHIGTPCLLTWILMHPTRPLRYPRRSLGR